MPEAFSPDRPNADLRSGVRALRLVRPPYNVFPTVLSLPARREEGSVLILTLDIEEILADPVASRQHIAGLRAMSLDCAMVGSLQGIEAVHITLLRRLGFGGLRAFVPPDCSVESLRLALGTANLPREDLAAWLTQRLDPRARRWAQGIAAVLDPSGSGPDFVPGGRLLAPAPSWRRWHVLGKLLHSLVRLQTDTRLTIDWAARNSRYLDAAGFHKACRNLLGCGPTEIRSRLGWEWILERFLVRSSR